MPKATYFHLVFSSILVFTVLVAVDLSAAPAGHAPWIGESFEGYTCKGQMENFGPFDYLQRHQLPDKLSIVEKYHFNANVEQLVSGQTNTGPLPDLGYTLRAWPNHHRALNSVIRYRVSELNNNRKQSRRLPSAECYLQRAINFSPNDGISHMLYGILLQRTGQKHLALTEYRKSLALEPANLQVKYNLGLLLVDLKEFTEANQLARDVYTQGYPLPGLKNKLQKAGQWNDSPQE